MSLQVWFPLNGHINNQGLGTVSNNLYSSPVYETGKMGKCLKTNFVKSSTLSCDELNGVREFSISFWFKMNTGSYTTWNDIITLNVTPDNGATTTQFRLETCNNTGTLINWFGGYFNAGGLSQYTVTNDTWYHQVIVVSESNIKFYVNDTLIKNYTIPSTYLGRYLTGTGIGLGDSGMNCSLNDLRIYDHCLSKKEIHEIYKSLILHYPLSGIGCDNLIANTYTGCNSGAGTCVEDGFNGFTYRYLKYEGTSYQDTLQGSCTVQPDTTYTLSFWAKGNCYIQSYFYPNNCASGKSSTGTTTSAADGNIPILLTDKWTKYWITWKTLSTASGTKNVLVGRIQNRGAGSECYIAGVKFEVGDKATPWVPNSSDSMYNSLGFNSTTVYDCSGYGNDGIMSSLLSLSSNTPRYTTCTKFNSSDYINCGTGAKVSDAITVSLWAYSDDWSAGDARFASCTQSGGWNFELADSKYRAIVNCNGQYYYCPYSKTISQIDPGWHMFTFTFDGFDLKAYFDGVLDNTCNVSSQKVSINYNTSNSIFIHAESSDNTNTPEGTAYKVCNMSDFRIYATALSAEDIKELYSSPISLDKSGNLYSYEFIEE